MAVVVIGQTLGAGAMTSTQDHPAPLGRNSAIPATELARSIGIVPSLKRETANAAASARTNAGGLRLANIRTSKRRGPAANAEPRRRSCGSQTRSPG
jgi:hypothetical protein